MPGITGWHPGETTLHTKLGFSSAVSQSWRAIEPQLREQHRLFHTSNLPFIPMAVVDREGRPWAGIAAGKDGEIGFVRGPDLKTLVMAVRVWRGEPLGEVLSDWSEARNGRELVAGLGIEFSTRRRNKFAGFIRDVAVVPGQAEGLDYVLEMEVDEAVGNCPKYINTRHFSAHPHTSPSITHRVQHMSPDERLPSAALEMILSADTVFLATLSKPTPETTSQFPAHAGMNARGGLPGFMRVLPSDGRTVVLPDYSGNRFMSSLGNIESSGIAGLTVISFETGDVLYLTGKARVLIGAPALEVMKRHASVTVLETTGYTLVRDALPVRQSPGSEVGRSPYSPKVKYLVEEDLGQAGVVDNRKARLESAVQLSEDLAVLRFKVVSKERPLRIRPGQAIVLDFMDWIGPPEYRHMADAAPGSINDDRVRTWTVSSAHDGDVAWFELTMREMKGGVVTGALFDVLRNIPPSNQGTVPVTDVVADIVGVTGDFCLTDEVNVLWVAGGIGITPFLAMLAALAGQARKGDIQFALSTREPAIMLDLIRKLLRNIPTVNIKIDLFTHYPPLDTEFDGTHISIHSGRIGPEYWKTVSPDKNVFICGPNEFGDAATEGLRDIGIPNERIHREGFY